MRNIRSEHNNLNRIAQEVGLYRNSVVNIERTYVPILENSKELRNALDKFCPDSLAFLTIDPVAVFGKEQISALFTKEKRNSGHAPQKRYW